MTENRKVALITGSSGFIGYHLCKRLLHDGWHVIGIDCLTDYYDVKLKLRRRGMLLQSEHFKDYVERIETPGLLLQTLELHKPDLVVHLAGQAGVRYSVENPRSYFDSNLQGTFELLEAVRQCVSVKHTLIASTSSVYGASSEHPFKETDNSDHQVSFYAATKKSIENLAHSFAHVYSIPITMFRFFTVYGPWGRPDMALFKFTKAMLANEAIDVYNHGKLSRDFTYVDDLIQGISLLKDVVPAQQTEINRVMSDYDSLSPVAPYRIVNIGNDNPVHLMTFIEILEQELNLTATYNFLEMQQGDMYDTWASVNLLKDLTDYAPSTELRHGIKAFVNWYKEHYNKS